MASCGVRIPSPNQHYSLSPLLQTLSSISSSRKPAPSLPPSTAAASPLTVHWSGATTGRRTISISFVGFMLSRFLFTSKAFAEPTLELLDRYSDPKEGFTLLVPSSWVKVKSTLFFSHFQQCIRFDDKWDFPLPFSI